MSPIVYRMFEVLAGLVEPLPVGTNLGLLHVLWAIVSGRLLSQRGAVLPALWACGIGWPAALRGWRALRHGRWRCSELVARLQGRVEQEQKWHAHVYGGYRPVACDLTAFYRPRLRNATVRHYSTVQQRSLPALVFGLLVRVGSVGTQRIPIPMAIVRGAPDASDDRAHMRRVLSEAAGQLAPCDVLVADRGFGVALLQECGVKQFVVRCCSNVVFHRIHPRPYCGHGRRPQYGAEVRPLARSYKGHLTPATPPDAVESWQEADGVVTAQVWNGLTIKAPAAGAPAFRVMAISDPRFPQPLLLATTLPLSADQIRAVYIDRWPVEMVPQVAKQMLGAQRQFVSAPECCQRLSELELTAACLMLYVAATQPPCPTGPWDRVPRPTSGRLRRVLATAPFPEPLPFSRASHPIRKKNSPTAHLPKGIYAHRRQPASQPPPATATKSHATHQLTRN